MNLISALEMVNRLQRDLDVERQTVKALRSASIASQASRGDLEAFFAQCVETVRWDREGREPLGPAGSCWVLLGSCGFPGTVPHLSLQCCGPSPPLSLSPSLSPSLPLPLSLSPSPSPSFSRSPSISLSREGGEGDCPTPPIPSAPLCCSPHLAVLNSCCH